MEARHGGDQENLLGKRLLHLREMLSVYFREASNHHGKRSRELTYNWVKSREYSPSL